MRKSKLGLDFAQVDAAKQLAKNIANQVQEFVDAYTTEEKVKLLMVVIMVQVSVPDVHIMLQTLVVTLPLIVEQ